MELKSTEHLEESLMTTIMPERPVSNPCLLMKVHEKFILVAFALRISSRFLLRTFDSHERRIWLTPSPL
eukprot:5296943-Pleurochrysis_carterae.AAC.1